APEVPAQAEEPAAAPEQQPVQGEAAPADQNAAPILDSQKDVRRPRKDGKDRKQTGEVPAENGAPTQTQPAAVDQGPPPADDKAAQQAIQPEKIEPVTEERGKRRDKAPDMRQRERPKGSDVLKEIGDRIIIQLGGETMVESNDRPRMTH